MKSWRCVVDARRARAYGMRLTPSSARPSSSLARACTAEVISRARRPAVRRIVFEAAILRRIVRRRHHDSVGQAGGAAAVVGQNGVRNRGRGRVVGALRNHDLDAVRGQHFHRAGEGGLGERMRIDAQEQRPIDAVRLAVFADGLRDGENVPLIEGAVEGRAAMARCAEAHLLRADRRDRDARRNTPKSAWGC